MTADERTVVVRDAAELVRPTTRRNFIRALGIGGSIVLMPGVFAACSDDDDITGGGTQGAVSLNLSNDIGIFKYAFILEQLEAAFYSQVVGASGFASTFTSADERELLTDIRNDEVTHREFLRTALGNPSDVNGVQPNFAAVNFSDRTSVLTTARTFEDLGVAAYNGAGRFLRNANNLLMAGKIVSVEARHAAALRDVLDTTNRAFADLTSLAQFGADNATGRDVALAPSAVLSAAQPYVATQITIGTQPS